MILNSIDYKMSGEEIMTGKAFCVRWMDTFGVKNVREKAYHRQPSPGYFYRLSSGVVSASLSSSRLGKF